MNPARWRPAPHLVALAAFGLAASGCVAEPQVPVGWPALSRASFVCLVEPVLERECSMPACHGAPKRRLRVLSPGRMRIAGELGRAIVAQAPADREAGLHPTLTTAEVDANLVSARGMVSVGNPGASPLLDRPLAVAAGGIFHTKGGDVFASRAAPGYRALLRWARGAGTEACP